MITTHDAIKHLAHKITVCKTTGEGWADCVNVDALEMATRALQKQEQMTVRAHHLCPSCGKDVIGSGYYCWHCGQHLKWENKDKSTEITAEECSYMDHDIMIMSKTLAEREENDDLN